MLLNQYLNWTLGLVLLSGNAFALTVEPFLPHKTFSPGGVATVYYADVSVAAAVDPEFPYYDLANSGSANNVSFTLRGMAPDLGNVFIFAEGSTQEENFPIRIRGSSVNVLPEGTHSYLNFAPGLNDVTVTLNLAEICNSGPAIAAKGCTGGGTFSIANDTLGLTLKFVQTAATAVNSIDAAAVNAGFQLKIYPETNVPIIGDAGVCPAYSSWFFPGDEEFTIDTNTFSATKATLGKGSNEFDTLIVAVGTPTLSASPYFGGSQISRIAYQSGIQTVTGSFINSTATAQNYYEANIGVRSPSGLVTFCSSPAYTQIFTTDIRSFLKESNCFIATASFRSGRAAPVMMLRKFRDQVLSAYPLGRALISFYYKNGPEAANWLIENPIYRVPVLSLLVKIEMLAWIALHPSVLLLPFFALIALLGFLGFRPSRGLTTAVLAVLSLQIGSAQAAQPFIDSLLSEIPKSTEPVRTNENPDPYIQSQKARLGAPSQEGSYSEEIKKELGEKDRSSEGYTENLKRNLGTKPSGDSAIADFKSGKKLKANKGGDHTDHVFAFKFGTAMERSYIGDATSQDLSYPVVYGDGWVPEMTITYEVHPIRSGFFSNLGIFGSAGGSFAKANGKFAFTGPSGEFTSSRTRFIFVTLPLSLGPIYRFHITNGIAPYFGGGGSAIGFIENRNDDKQSVRGYSFGYWSVVGISFGLDFLSRKMSWNQYESTGVKRTYLSLEYSYLSTIPGGLVEATVEGVQAGLTFEY
jgi:hypothetical protein